VALVADRSGPGGQLGRGQVDAVVVHPETLPGQRNRPDGAEALADSLA